MTAGPGRFPLQWPLIAGSPLSREKIMKNTLLAAATGSLLALSGAAFAAGQSSASYKIPADVINNGVADMSSASYKLSSSVGDAFATAGPLQSATYKLFPGFRAETSGAATPLNLLAVNSRKLHAAAGSFDLGITTGVALAGSVSVEPRVIGTGHVIAFKFDAPVTSVGAATVTDSLAASAGTAVASFNASNEVLVTLTGVADNKRVTVTVNGINGATTATATMAFLVGDVNNTRSVTTADAQQVKGRSGQAIGASTFLYDVGLAGIVRASSILATKGRNGLVTP
jgi:hypothetical protein